MDAAELDALLQDVRDYMIMVRGGDKPFIDALTEIARESKPAAKGIGHIIEQHLLKTDAAYKIGAFLLIDSIVQNVGEPYVTYFSANFPRMFREVWSHSGPTTQERMRRWLAHYRQRQTFPAHVLAEVQVIVDPASRPDLASGTQHMAAGTVGRHDPRRQDMAVHVPAHPSTSDLVPGPTEQSNGQATAMRMGTKMPPQQTVGQWQGGWGMAGPAGPLGSTSYGPAGGTAGHHATLGYNSFQGGSHLPLAPLPGMPVRTQPPGAYHGAPLGTTFAGVRLQAFHPEALAFLNEVTRKIRTHLNDRRIQRERVKREQKTVRMRQWYAPASIWVRGAVAAAAAVDEVNKQPSVASQQSTGDDIAAHRFVVVKDDSQPRCALCSEPFTEGWDDALQEWVYLDAVRLPASIAEQPDIGLPAGAIVKVALLDPDARRLLRASVEGTANGTATKRGGEWQVSDDEVDPKKAKVGWDSDDEAVPAIKKEA